MTTPATPLARPAVLHEVARARPGDRGILGLVRRSPLAAFLVLACLLSWWPWPLYEAGLMPLPIASFGPFLAALVVLGITQGRGGVARLLRSMVRWRIPARAYLWAVGIPLLCSGSAVLLNLALGATTPPTGEVLTLVRALPLAFVVVLLVPGFGGALEEPGFRGYALGRLEDRFGWTAGPLVLGLFIVLWHLPVFATEGIEWTDVLVIPAASVVIAGVFHLGRESVLIAMLTHAVNNAIGGAFATPLFTGADSVQLGALTAVAWWFAAVVVIVHRRGSGRSTVDDLGQSRHPSGVDPSL